MKRYVLNALSVDVEDWFHGVPSLNARRRLWNRIPSRLHRSTDRLLDLFDRHQVKATFFVLGWIARTFPELVDRIRGRGHSIGSHGYNHARVRNRHAGAFESDLAASLDAIARVTGTPPVSYRAPYFSAEPRCRWFYAALARNGIRYDSSVYPVSGWCTAPRMGPVGYPYLTEEGVVEFPASTLQLGPFRLPAAGGVCLRLLPARLPGLSFARANRRGIPCLLYVHPADFDHVAPAFPLKRAERMIRCARWGDPLSRLRRLLSAFAFAPVERAAAVAIAERARR